MENKKVITEEQFRGVCLKRAKRKMHESEKNFMKQYRRLRHEMLYSGSENSA